MKFFTFAAVLSAVTTSLYAAPGSIHLLQKPTINKTEIVFSYSGDLWHVGKEGGVASRLTSGQGFESDAAFAGELRTELGKLGASVQVVDDGNVGLQAAASERPDLILLSIELPRMNGFSVCNKLKKDPALKDVPLIIMSSESSDETFEQHRKRRGVELLQRRRVDHDAAVGLALQRLRQHAQRVARLAQRDGRRQQQHGVAFSSSRRSRPRPCCARRAW